MTISHYDWPVTFGAAYEHGAKRYAAGCRVATEMFTKHQVQFLAGLGCSAQELYDFVEDGAPDFASVALITAARRDYFLVVQGGRPTDRKIRLEDLPGKEEALAGFVWLPRLIVKARAKLRGEMPAELMYGCGGDRAFFKRVNVHPADFLRLVWAAGDDQKRIVEFVKHHVAGLASGTG